MRGSLRPKRTATLVEHIQQFQVLLTPLMASYASDDFQMSQLLHFLHPVTAMTLAVVCIVVIELCWSVGLNTLVSTMKSWLQDQGFTNADSSSVHQIL